MDSNFSEALSLAAIDRQINDDNQNLSPAQYEIARQVIYRTADFEYASLLKFSEGVLANGVTSLADSVPILVDVPEIQVSIVPRLQQTFHNPVYCCATVSGHDGNLQDEANQRERSKIVLGLERLAQDHPHGIFIIGRSETALTTLMKLIEGKVISPRLAIATAPMLIEPEKKKFLGSACPCIYVDGSKGGDTVASAIFNTLINLSWRAYGNQQKNQYP